MFRVSPTRKKNAEACFFQLYSPSASDIVFQLCSVALSCIALRAAKKANRISLQPKGAISLCGITAKYRISQSEIFQLFFRGFEFIQQKRKSIFFLLHRQRMRFLSLVFYSSKISKPAPHCTDSTMWGRLFFWVDICFAHFCAYFLEIIKIGQTNRIICLKTLKARKINMVKQRKSTIGIDRF